MPSYCYDDTRVLEDATEYSMCDDIWVREHSSVAVVRRATTLECWRTELRCHSNVGAPCYDDTDRGILIRIPPHIYSTNAKRERRVASASIAVKFWTTRRWLVKRNWIIIAKSKQTAWANLKMNTNELLLKKNKRHLYANRTINGNSFFIILYVFPVGKIYVKTSAFLLLQKWLVTLQNINH